MDTFRKTALCVRLVLFTFGSCSRRRLKVVCFKVANFRRNDERTEGMKIIAIFSRTCSLPSGVGVGRGGRIVYLIINDSEINVGYRRINGISTPIINCRKEIRYRVRIIKCGYSLSRHGAQLVNYIVEHTGAEYPQTAHTVIAAVARHKRFLSAIRFRNCLY